MLWRRFHCITKWDLFWLAKKWLRLYFNELWGYAATCSTDNHPRRSGRQDALYLHLQSLQSRYRATSSRKWVKLSKKIAHIESSPMRMCFPSCKLKFKNWENVVDFLPLTVNRPFPSQATRIAQTPLTSLKIAHGVFCLEQWDVFPQTLWERTTLSRRSAAPVLGRGRTSPYK